MLRTFTLDTNCLIAVANNEPAAGAVRALADAHTAGRADVAVVAMSASEKQQGGHYIRNFAVFRDRLVSLGLGHLNVTEAAVQQAGANARNAEIQSQRRQKLNQLAVTIEEQQTYATTAVASQALYQQALANLDQARVNLERTQVRSPVNGWVTHLLAQLGDYANVGQNIISIVDADSFWVDGYFEEINLGSIREGDPAEIKLMGYSQIVRGHVGSIARGINVPNAQANQQGLATVNPIFTWVRLAQRIPVRIHIDEVPKGVVLAAGMTATVQIDPRPRPQVK